ncbi:MAG TPA: hypothetical protein PK442_06545, partial [Synergistales bacterium]|nr:hypothetical protein [Synergistales bacterium]
MERIGDSLSRGMDICSSKDGGAPMATPHVAGAVTTLDRRRVSGVSSGLFRCPSLLRRCSAGWMPSSSRASSSKRPESRASTGR